MRREAGERGLSLSEYLRIKILGLKTVKPFLSSLCFPHSTWPHVCCVVANLEHGDVARTLSHNLPLTRWKRGKP
ncbi:hypothetical protein [Infirmifilum sp. NZ]|uniref:hypothetical protein n=1 Tax=Infirmifilum sp. NZ TaxID=2926850 RepID=UPI003FA3D705